MGSPDPILGSKIHILDPILGSKIRHFGPIFGVQNGGPQTSFLGPKSGFWPQKWVQGVATVPVRFDLFGVKMAETPFSAILDLSGGSSDPEISHFGPPQRPFLGPKWPPDPKSGHFGPPQRPFLGPKWPPDPFLGSEPAQTPKITKNDDFLRGPATSRPAGSRAANLGQKWTRRRPREPRSRPKDSVAGPGLPGPSKKRSFLGS